MNRYRLGCPARSLAGHDRGKYYIIVAESSGAVLLADGKGRGLQNPKRKNKKHVQVCQTPLFGQIPGTDKELARTLTEYCRSR